jgi:hypothetical protein
MLAPVCPRTTIKSLDVVNYDLKERTVIYQMKLSTANSGKFDPERLNHAYPLLQTFLLLYLPRSLFL